MRGRLLAATLSLIACPSQGQGFGQNHVVLRDFHWQIRSTEHFDIHYYEGSEPLVPAAADILEKAYAKISRGLSATFKERRPFFLYASVNDMQQSNIVEVGDGTGGVTEAFKDRFMIYNDGTKQWLDDVATHELVHVFQYSVLVSGFWKSARILKSVVYPLWMMEGMAEYFTAGLDDTTQEYYVRDAATSGGLIPLWKLEHFSHLKPHQVTLAYKSGATLMEFVASQYGQEKIGEMLRLFESRFESNAMLQELVGMDIFAFDKKWREFLEERYRRVLRRERLQEPTAFGVRLTTGTSTLPEFNTSPVFTPDGRRMAYISTRAGHPPTVMIQDLHTGRRRALVLRRFVRLENIELGRFVQLSRVLALSPDGGTLAFVGQKNHRESLFLYDLRRGRLSRVPLPGFMTASEPAFSPDGRRIAFTGMKDSVTNLYLLDRTSGRIEAVTNDPADDQSPAFSPDGRYLIYSSEVKLEASGHPYQRRLYRVDLATGKTQRLLELAGEARDPVFSADGRRILFGLQGKGFADIYELELESGRVWRLTRSIGASLTPIYTPAGEIAFSSFRRNSVHIYRARRASLLNEPVLEAKFLPGPSSLQIGSAPERLPGMSISTSTWRGAVWRSTAAADLGEARPYGFKFSTDLLLPALFYSSQGGLFLMGYWQGSDMLGNHQLGAMTTMNTGQGYYNYQTQYAYRRFRPQLSLAAVGVIQENATDPTNRTTANQSAHAQIAGAAYPLDRFHRIETLLASVENSRSYPGNPAANNEQRERIASAAFVRDTVGGRYLVATFGSRLRLGFQSAYPNLGGNVRYNTFAAIAHQFIPTGSWSALALKGFIADSNGPNRHQFQLGGLGGIRGYAASVVENVGNRALLTTAEWRFPVWKNMDYYMWYFFPDFYFKAVTGAVFTDAGYVWNSRRQLATARWGDINQSIGAGLRLHAFILQLFPLVLAFDYARPTTANTPGVFYVYLGPLF